MLKGLDTNILVYALTQQDEEKQAKASEILKTLIQNPNNYTVSVQVLAETIYVVSRKAPEVLPEAIKLTRLLSKTIRVLYYTPEEVEQAAEGNPKQFWDRLLAYTYRNNGVEEIITEDEKPYRGLLRTVNPFKRNPQL